MDNEVIAAVVIVYGITIKQLIGSSRKRHITEARKMACLFLSEKMKQVDIANIINFNRSMVSYNVREITSHIKLYPDVKSRYERVYKLVEPQGELELLKISRRKLEASLIENPLSPPDFRYAQIKELDKINNKISNLLKVEL